MRDRDFRKPFPGYKGRGMINRYDFTADIDGTKQLAQKQQINGSIVVRHHPISMKNPFGIVLNQKQQKQMASNQSTTYSIKKSSGTPMKTLIAKELSKETEYKQQSPTIVARLMGLDSLPLQKPALIDKKYPKVQNSCHNLAGTIRHHRWKEDKRIGIQARSSLDKKVYKDLYEVWEQSSRAKIKNNSMRTGNCDGNSYQARMSLVREKFLEAKRLATDVKFLQSREFQDAIEILSSNRDLFLRFLDEPNSLFSKHFHGLGNGLPPPQTKCITLLKPLNTVGENGEKEKGMQLRKASDDRSIGKTLEHSWISNFLEVEPHTLPQPTRIVVLKPSPGMPHDTKKVVGSPVSSPTLLDRQELCISLQNNESMGSKELAKEITRRIRENLSGQRKGGDLLSSIFANGYIGDTSSFTRTDSDYVEEEDGSLSDSEVATPISRHSWDFLNRNGSPFSLSSISRASYTPESSVTREAKKRLCERLALVASNADSQDQGQENRSPSTLGEMLAVLEIQKLDELNATSSKLSDKGQSIEVSSPIFSHIDNECYESDSARKLSRSKSVPASSTDFEATELDIAASYYLNNEPVTHKEPHKSKSVKFSLKSKLSSLFFSRNKKVNKDKPTISSSVHSDDDKLHAGNDYLKLGDTADNLTECLGDICSARPLSLSDEEISAACTTSLDDESNMLPLKGALSLEKHMQLNMTQDLDHTSAISVLEAPFVNDTNNSLSQSTENYFAGNPQALSRSPPIGTVARSLSTRAPCLETTSQSPYHMKPSRILSKADEEHKQFLFVERLISSSGLANYETSTTVARWYSMDAPLNPVLLDELEYTKDDEDINTKGMRSSEKLLFDCVNSALLLMSLKTTLASYPWTRACTDAHDNSLAGATFAEVIWGIIRSWFFVGDWEVECKSTRTVVETLVKREVTGRQWAESLWLETEEFIKEIGGKLLEELVEESLSELIM